MNTYLKPIGILFLLGIAQWLHAQTSTTENMDFQSNLRSRLGIKRMVVVTTKSAASNREANRNWTTETFFDTQGRTMWTTNEACSECQTVYEYDSLSGLVSYYRIVWNAGVSESFIEYDDQNRRTVVETCKKGEESCLTTWFDYDEEDTERMYQETSKRHLKYDKTKHMRLQFTRESSKQLVRETFYSPEKKLEEIKEYKNGEYKFSLLNEYDELGRQKNIWRQTGATKQLDETFEYNEKGQVASRKTRIDFVNSLYPERNFLRTTYEYDDNGLLIKSFAGTTTKEYSYFTD